MECHASERFEFEHAAIKGIILERAQRFEVTCQVALNLEVFREADLPAALHVVALVEDVNGASVTFQALRYRAINLIVTGLYLLALVWLSDRALNFFGFLASIDCWVVNLEEQHLRESFHEDYGTLESTFVVNLADRESKRPEVTS